MQRKSVQLVVIIIGLALIVNLSRDIFRLWGSLKEVYLVEEKAQELEKERQLLLKKKDYFQSKEFIEEEARNKLNMARPNETIVILPENIKEALGQKQIQEQKEEPNWKKWWGLFF